MPCYGGPDPHTIERENSDRLKRVEAIACELMNQLIDIQKSIYDIRRSDAILDIKLDWNESRSGITKQLFADWWEQHDIKDQRRKADDLVNKMTPEEYNLLEKYFNGKLE